MYMPRVMIRDQRDVGEKELFFGNVSRNAILYSLVERYSRTIYASQFILRISTRDTKFSCPNYQTNYPKITIIRIWQKLYRFVTHTLTRT